MKTGLVMWWLGSIFEVPPVRLGASIPGNASITLLGSVDFTFSTALTHMAKPMTWASIGSLVTFLGFFIKAFQSAMNWSLASPLMVETTAVFLPAEPNFLMSDTMVCQSECPNGV